MKLHLSHSVLLGLLTALSIALPAMAQQEGRRSGHFAQDRNAEGMRQSMQRRHEMKSQDGKSERHMGKDAPPERQAAEQKAHQGHEQGRERLSPEERRQLRRDINAAGRDIYRRNGP